MPATLLLNQFQTTQNLNRPDDSDAMDPTATFALADTMMQGIVATIRAFSVDLAGTSGIGTNTAGIPWVSLIGLLGSWSGPLLISYIGNVLTTSQFSIQGDQRFFYPVGNRIRAFATAGILYGTVTAVSFGGGITTITVQMDSGGFLDAGINTINAGGTPTQLSGGDVQASCLHPNANAIPGNVNTQSTNPTYVAIDNGGSGVNFVDTGTVISPPLAAYPVGPIFAFKFGHTIPAGGAPTVNLTGPSGLLGAVNLVKSHIDPNTGTVTFPQLEPADIVAGEIGLFIYDGTNFQYLGLAASKAVLVVSTGGSGNTYTATPVPAFQSYDQGVIYLFQFTQTNPGPSTNPVVVNISGLGNKNVVKNGSTALQQNDIGADQIVPLIYDGTNFQVLGPLASLAPAAGPGSTPVGPPTGILSVPAMIPGSQTINGSTLSALNTATPSSMALTAPAAGGPFRLLVSWFCAIDGSPTSHPADVEFDINDGSASWAQGGTTVVAGGTGSAGGSGLSPNVYADAATVTITIRAIAKRADASGGLGGAIDAGGLSKGAIQSAVSAAFIPCN